MSNQPELKHPALNNGELRYQHLVGLEFKYGLQDCYRLMQRMFEDNLNIIMPNYARPNDFWLYDYNFYMDNFTKQGFERIEPPPGQAYKPFDTFLISIPDSRNVLKSVTNHCAVYLGAGMVIHHRLGKLSEVIPYRYTMKDYTTCVIRHKKIPELIDFKGTDDNILNHILPSKKQYFLGSLNERANRTS